MLLRTIARLVALVACVIVLASASAVALGSLLPEGDVLAFVSDRDGEGDIYLMDVERALVFRLTHLDAWVEALSWSPDGRQIAFSSARKGSTNIFSVDVFAEARAVRNLTKSNAFDVFPIWSPDGEWIAYFTDVFRGSRLRLMRANGENNYGVSLSVSSVGWSPDGASLMALLSGPEELEIYRVDVQNETVHPVISYRDRYIGVPVWSPDATRIAFRSSPIFLTYQTLLVMDVTSEAGTIYPVSQRVSRDVELVWSPDGERLAFVSTHGGGQDIYVADVPDEPEPERVYVRNLTDQSGRDFHPTWSSDGNRIAFESVRDGNHEIYVVDVSSGTIRRLTHHSAFDTSPAWRP